VCVGTPWPLNATCSYELSIKPQLDLAAREKTEATPLKFFKYALYMPIEGWLLM